MGYDDIKFNHNYNQNVFTNDSTQSGLDNDYYRRMDEWWNNRAEVMGNTSGTSYGIHKNTPIYNTNNLTPLSNWLNQDEIVNNNYQTPGGDEDGYVRSGDYGDRNDYMQPNNTYQYGPLNRLFRYGFSGLKKESEEDFYAREKEDWMASEAERKENELKQNQIDKEKAWNERVNSVQDDKGFYSGKLNASQQDDAWFKHQSGMDLNEDEQLYIDNFNSSQYNFRKNQSNQEPTSQEPTSQEPAQFDPNSFDPNADNSIEDIKKMQEIVGTAVDGDWGPNSKKAYEKWQLDNKNWFQKSRDERKSTGDWYAGKQIDKWKENKESGEKWYPGKMLTDAWENSRIGGGPGLINPNRYKPTGEKMSKSDVNELNQKYSDRYNSSMNMNYDRPGGYLEGRRFEQMHNDPDYLAHVKSYWPEQYSQYEAAVADKNSPLYSRLDHSQNMKNIVKSTGNKAEYDYISGKYHSVDSQGNKTEIDVSGLDLSSDDGFANNTPINNAMDNQTKMDSKNEPYNMKTDYPDWQYGDGIEMMTGFPTDLKASNGQVYMISGKKLRYKGPDGALMQRMFPMGKSMRNVMKGTSKNWEIINE